MSDRSLLRNHTGSWGGYSRETIEWFDTNWSAGLKTDRIIAGMKQRGHIMTRQQAGWLASRRGLYRPPGFSGVGGRPTFERIIELNLLRERPRLLQDNPVAKPTQRFTNAGGFSMLTKR